MIGLKPRTSSPHTLIRIAMRDSFVFYREWRDALVGLPDGVRMEVYDAIVEYGVTGKLPELKPMAELAFRFIKQRMDKDIERYDEIIRKRSEAGKKHRGNQYSKENEISSVGTNGTSVPMNGTNGTHVPSVGTNGTSIKSVDNKETNKESAKEINKEIEENNKENQYYVLTKEKEKNDDADITSPPPLTDEQQAKVEKGRKYKYAEYVTLTKDEYAKLCEAHTEEGARRMIEILDNYKGQNGRRYKSDYRAILNWVVDRYNEEITKPAYGNGRKNIASEERATAAAGVIGRLFATNEPVES